MFTAHAGQFYINGAWVAPSDPSRTLDVINPATETAIATIGLGTAADVDKAVAAAKAAFPAFSRTSRDERIALLAKILEVYQRRYNDIAAAITAEVGAPTALSQQAQAAMGLAHLGTTIEALKQFKFEEPSGGTLIVKEPIGVVGLITPWNWPINQIAAKVAPALAAGCTMVLKPSEIAPLNAILWAEIFDEAGVPAGVFNLVNGEGPVVGEAMARHPDIDMMSFTGSTRAGVAVAKNAADTVKRVHQELGGKSPNILLDDADLNAAVMHGMQLVLANSGQSCNAPTRLIVPRALHDQVVGIASAIANGAKVGDPTADGTALGPVISKAQWSKIQSLIEKGIAEGATVAAGGPGLPDGVSKGYYVRPTVFANVTNSMTVAREEIFGPVVVVIPYDSEDEAIRIANDTPYGLSGYVSGSLDRARAVASHIRAGMVHVNGTSLDVTAPFGGYKQSGNGREFGAHGLAEFLETKAVMGYAAA
jgi:aldehyde dehydrogenase (NAD+)